jgi:hypothetical protein
LSTARRLLFASVLGILAACGGRLHSAPQDSIETKLPIEWREAQLDLARLDPLPEGDPHEITPFRFVIQAEAEPFYCGESGIHAVLLVYGCFRVAPEEERLGVIRYVPHEGVLRHEARHAILYALGDPRWADVGH